MSSQPLLIALIVGCTRAGRFCPVVADWFATQAALRPDMALDVIDLADVELPSAYPAEPSPAVAAYAERIGAADAYVVVTPEYNHGYPAVLKQAIDLPREEWKAKAVGFVSYGGVAGGLRAVEQLRQVFAELHVATMRDTVSFHNVHRAFDGSGQPRDPEGAVLAATTMLDQLAWWARALRSARMADHVSDRAA